MVADWRGRVGGRQLVGRTNNYEHFISSAAADVIGLLDEVTSTLPPPSSADVVVILAAQDPIDSEFGDGS